MGDRPLAYHITFGTYGTRLHGDPRGTVDRTQNQPGDPIIGQNEDWLQLELSNLKGDPVWLDETLCRSVELAAPDICVRGGWQHHVTACQANHVHMLVSSDDEGKLVRRLIKRWLTQHLNDTGLIRPVRWWAKGGSVKWVWDQAYFDNVYEYVVRQRTTKSEPHRPRRGPP